VKRYIIAVMIAFDVLCSALTGGHASETLSYRFAKARRDGGWVGCVMCRLLGHIQSGHCEKSLAWYKEHNFDASN
jgi:hypothetical protein